MDYIRTQILQQYPAAIPDPTDVSAPPTRVVVYIAHSFELYYTYDGIDVCGTRVANEIEHEVARLDGLQDGGRVTKLSVVGYSLGGLISRYAIGLLYQRGMFDSADDSDAPRPDSSGSTGRFRGIVPVVFTTFASPHLGVLALGMGPLSRMYNAIAPYVLSYTSRQLCLTDDFAQLSSLDKHRPGTPDVELQHQRRPLLDCMADPALPFLRGLARFHRLASYGNIVNDHRTEWYTTAMTSTDPFTRNAAAIVGPYVPGYGPTIIDASAGRPLEILRGGLRGAGDGSDAAVVVAGGVLGFVGRQARRLARLGLAVFKVTVAVPVWFVAFLLNVAYQTTVSTVRKHHFVKSEVFATFNSVFSELDTSGETEPLLGESAEELVPAEPPADELSGSVHDEDLSFSRKLHEEAGEALDSVLGAVKYESQLDLTALDPRADPSPRAILSHRQRAASSVEATVAAASAAAEVPESATPDTSILQLQQFSASCHTSPSSSHVSLASLPPPAEPSLAGALNLRPVHRAIIRNLNTLPWRKFPVHITRATHTHAAIIVRYPTPLFDEGKKVVDHWVKHIFMP